MSLESATHIAFPFLNSFPLSNHISGVPGCFLNFVQIWIRFGILPEIKSNLALKLAVVHFAAHVWITNFLVKRTSWYSPTKKNICSAVSKIWRNGLASQIFWILHVFQKNEGCGLVPFFFLFLLGFCGKFDFWSSSLFFYLVVFFSGKLKFWVCFQYFYVLFDFWRYL